MNLALTKPTAKEEVDDMRNEAFKDRKTLTIAVEGKDDVAFWSFVFNRSAFRNQYRIFRSYNFPTADASGKNTLAHFLPHTQRDFAICIDSDYDYLLDNSLWQDNSFVFQTYTYSIENHYCYVPSLNTVVNRAANLPVDTEGVSFEDIFIEKFSKIIYELLVESLQESIDTGVVAEARRRLGESIRLRAGRTIEAMLEHLDTSMPNKIQNLSIINTFRQQLSEKGLTPETAYLFARGHDVLNSVFLPILKIVQEEMKSRKLLELETIEDERLKNAAKKEYRMNVINVHTCLLENRNFTDNFLFQKIQDDIREAFQ
jgi:Protein of unknown function (DUF4435)